MIWVGIAWLVAGATFLCWAEKAPELPWHD